MGYVGGGKAMGICGRREGFGDMWEEGRLWGYVGGGKALWILITRFYDGKINCNQESPFICD